ncbi:type III secretion system export apparatus subunit SctT [Chitinasiproducens palmae]|uniref:Type III secretion protein T n=1 Tax=Chitinasiproducens palmae TaxID=1770053 RepID=A0A1H2PJ05_9BURK|nr:type III secretion system export apparatus subunit SctT [Chitinasiproducens palmae]SDV46287.1 type III secretion protein T [Chitinasiproducens palmae]
MLTLIDMFFAQAVAFSYAGARTLPVFMLLPCLGERILPGVTVRATLVVWTAVGLGVSGDTALPDLPTLAFSLGREAAIGLLLSLPLCLPFWVAQAVGELLDNQRGATLAESIDPASGHESSTLASFLGMLFSAIFFAGDGLHTVVRALQRSYDAWPIGGLGSVGTVLGLLSTLLAEGMRLAAPAMLVMLLGDAILGIYSRYCAQVNAFSLSLSIKSLLAFAVLLLYLGDTVGPGLWTLWLRTGTALMSAQ